ncbi:MAG: class I SAM-dependent methyltransferase [Pseudomonadota bacterium]
MTGTAASRLGYFDGLYGDDPDPYGLRTRWYEERKRAVLMASLPHARYARVYEPGCGAGELTVDLAARCDDVLASDFSDKALASARRRAIGLPNVRFQQHVLPRDWPHEEPPFDLIVVSELGYFLDAESMTALAACAVQALSANGVLVACDWRPDFAERASSTDNVHEAFAATGLTRSVRHEEADFLLEVWGRDPLSVAQREGIR